VSVYFTPDDVRTSIQLGFPAKFKGKFG
jgi:hypothetical protein